ncbi:MAG: hypothetical protein GXY53_04055 [Desulfobulbus sp.]|nr:hypothetical protein [Desulfobulbus sp.]
MLIPREKPYLQGLNSYYLQLERFIEHMQGDIGAGSIHCRSARVEMMIYFNESEIISNLIQEKGQTVQVVPSLEIARSTFYCSSCSVNVYQLDANAIYFWAQMPAFQRAKTSLKSSEIPLPDLIFRLRQKQFSGFIDVQLMRKDEGGILFFNEGDRIGGSFSWSTGGMSTSDEDYNTLLSRVQLNDGLFSFGSFIKGS